MPRYTRPDPAGEQADEYNRYAPSQAASGNAASGNTAPGNVAPVARYNNTPAGHGAAAAPVQPWPEDPPQRPASNSRDADAGAPPGRLPESVARRALPLRFEPVADHPRAEASQASMIEPAVKSPSDRPVAERHSETPDAPSPALPPPSAASPARGEARPHVLPPVSTMLGSLAVVVGLFLALAWVVRVNLPKGPPSLPRDAVEMLGRTLLTGRQYVHLVRCGNKMLLVAITASGAETLTEITDPVEVDRLAGICYSTRPQSASANFRQMLQNFGTEKPPVGRRRGRHDDLDFSNLAAIDQYTGPSGGSA